MNSIMLGESQSDKIEDRTLPESSFHKLDLMQPWEDGPGRPQDPGPAGRDQWYIAYNTSGRNKEIGRPRWPQWATETRGLQAGQDLAWGGLNRGTGAGACCSASPVPVPRVVPQLHCPTPSHAHLSVPARQARQKKKKIGTEGSSHSPIRAVDQARQPAPPLARCVHPPPPHRREAGRCRQV